MADVSSTLAAWSSTTASNNPSGSTTIGTNLDDNLREIQGVLVRGLSHKGADIASAGTTDLGAIEGLMHDITGTTTITSLGTVRAGIWKIVKFEGALKLTHNATSLILPGASDITTADGDTAIVMSEGSGNWRCIFYGRAASFGHVSGTEQATTSGTAINFTGIPAWVRKIVVQFVGVSGNGTSNLMVQIGDSGGLETTGYLSAAQTGTTATGVTSGFVITAGNAAAAVWHGTLVLTLEDVANNTWVGSAVMARSDTDAAAIGAGSKSLSAVLDRLTILFVNGTDAFDAGAANILYSA